MILAEYLAGVSIETRICLLGILRQCNIGKENALSGEQRYDIATLVTY